MFAAELPSLEALPPGNDVVEAEVDLQKTRLLFRNTGMAQLVVVINAGVLVLVLGGLRPPAWALAWWAVAAVIAAARYSLARRFLADEPTAAAAGVWRQKAVVGALVAGLVWGGGGVALMVADPDATRLFAALVMAGMVAGAVPILSSVPDAYRAYAVPVMSAIILTALFDAYGPRDNMLAFVAVLFLASLMRSARYFHDSLDRSIRLALHMRQVAEQLELARKLERDVHREQRQFVATMSHELRTPLAVIDAAAQNLTLLNAASLDPAAGARLEKIQLAADRLAAIIDECLTPERLGVVVDPPCLKTVPVRDLLADAAEAAKMFSEAHRVEVECDDATTAQCDPELFRLVLRTLADNAVKYTPAGSCVRLRAETTGAGTRIEIADNGPGIAAEELPHVFEKYFRGRTAIAHAGTGLGLPLARHVVERIGGTITVSSARGQGTTFTIDLPAPSPRAT